MKPQPDIPSKNRRPCRLGDSVVHVLDADPDLAVGLDEAEFRTACRLSLASRVTFGRGPWAPAKELHGLQHPPTLLLLTGLLAHRVEVNERQTVELLGPGDVLSPREWARSVAGLPIASDWRVHEAGALAVLDLRWRRRLGRWPEVQVTLLDRTLERSHAAVLRLALARTPNLPERLNLLLWQLAGRWGRVVPGGVALPLPLPQETLAALACAQRESVSRALAELTRYGLVARLPGAQGWLLRGVAPAELEDLGAGAGRTLRALRTSAA